MTSYTPRPGGPATDRTTVFGVVGIVGAICCLPIGILFGVLSIRAARRSGTSPTLGYIAIGLSGLALIVHLILWAVGDYTHGWW
jgi:hypothetical protein